MWTAVLFSLCGHVWITSAFEDTLHTLPGLNMTLNCTARMKSGVQYHAVRWYKESVDPRLTGLVSRALPGGRMKWYVGADTQISLEEGTLSLKLPTLNCSDGGVYLCYLAAPVGEQNREGRVRLTVTGCPTEKPSEPEKLVDINIENVPLGSKPALQNLVLYGAIGMISAFSVVTVFFLVHKCLRKTMWRETKTPGNELYLELNSFEKQDLLWTLGFPPKKSEIIAV